MYYTLRINSMKWNMRYLFGFLVPFPFPSPVWKTGIICFFKQEKYDMHRKLQHPAHPGATPLSSDKNFW